MSEAQDQIIVVAQPGYQVLLNVGTDCLIIDAFNPVNLSEMYDEEVLRNCGSLKTHLHDGHLVAYTGQDLPKDPNTSKIDALRQSKAQHIQTQFEQTAKDSRHPNMQIETTVEKVDEASLQEQVEKSRKQIEADSQKIHSKMSHDYSDVDSPPPSIDPTAPADETIKDKFNLKVSMDVDPKLFKERQTKTREQLEQKSKEAEDAAREEIARIQQNEDSNNTGG